MNNQTTYTLLVRSEEKGRSLTETVVYALLGLSVLVSILQFAGQPNPFPSDEETSQSYSAPHASCHQTEAGWKRKS